MFSGHVIFEILVDRRFEDAVEVVRARNVDLCHKVARLHLEPPNNHLQLGVRDGVFVAQKVGDQFEQLVDVLVRVVDHEVVVLEPHLHATLMERRVAHRMLDGEDDLVLVLGAIIGLHMHEDVAYRWRDVVDASHDVGQDRARDVRSAGERLVHVVEEGAVPVHLDAHDAEHALVAAFAVLRDLVFAKMRARGLGLVHEVVDERDFEQVGTVRRAVDALHDARVVVVAELFLLEQVALKQQKQSKNERPRRLAHRHGKEKGVEMQATLHYSHGISHE